MIRRLSTWQACRTEALRCGSRRSFCRVRPAPRSVRRNASKRAVAVGASMPPPSRLSIQSSKRSTSSKYWPNASCSRNVGVSSRVRYQMNRCWRRLTPNGDRHARRCPASSSALRAWPSSSKLPTCRPLPTRSGSGVRSKKPRVQAFGPADACSVTAATRMRGLRFVPARIEHGCATTMAMPDSWTPAIATESNTSPVNMGRFGFTSTPRAMYRSPGVPKVSRLNLRLLPCEDRSRRPRPRTLRPACCSRHAS